MPRTWPLAEHGDSFEREWASLVTPDFPMYETFWQRHVVPLSFRVREPDNPFIRPSLPPHLIALADASYAVFYHVAHGHAYEQQLHFRKDYRDFPRPTECLYCFFTHAHSAHEALLHFGCAVNRALREYGRDEVFRVERDGAGHPFRLGGGSLTGASGNCASVDIDAYERLQSLLSAYRNLLIHEKPIFLQSDWLPRTRELDRYAGLTGIGELVKDPSAQERDFRPVGDALAEVMGKLKGVADMVFGVGCCALDGLGETGYGQDQVKVKEGDHRLKRGNFERVRER